MSALISTVMMATLVVGLFYLSRALGLDEALVGLVLSVGPLVAALTGVPAGRIADHFGAQRMTIVGLIEMAAGSFVLSMTPATLGVPGYIAPIGVITVGYALFQAANNTEGGGGRRKRRFGRARRCLGHRRGVFCGRRIEGHVVERWQLGRGFGRVAQRYHLAQLAEQRHGRPARKRP
jgi:hypothetical protein